MITQFYMKKLMHLKPCIYNQNIYRSEDAKNQVKAALGVLSMDEYRLLLEYVREWNTKPKLCHIAQFVLLQVFSILSPTEIVEVLFTPYNYLITERMK